MKETPYTKAIRLRDDDNFHEGTVTTPREKFIKDIKDLHINYPCLDCIEKNKK